MAEDDANSYWKLIKNKFSEQKGSLGLDNFELGRTMHWYKGDTVWLRERDNPQNKIKVLKIGNHYTYDLINKQEYRIIKERKWFTNGRLHDMMMI